VTATYGVLGIRHFVLDKSKSTFQVRIPPGLTIPVGNFEGQTNGVTEPAFLDLEAGQPDAQGITKVNIVRASEYIFADAREAAGFVFCIKMQVPAPEAGILACNGGVDISISLNTDHNIGKVGVDGFTAAQCEALGGRVEVPYSTCGAGLVGQLCQADADCDTSAGSNDGACTNHFPGTCVAGKTGACQTNADCDSESEAGFCGTPHGGVCNGPLVPVIESGDTGPGALVIAPNPEPPYQINGIPVELKFESDLPCGDEGPGMPSPFALTTGTMKSVVTDSNNDAGHQLNFQTTGENFSCQDWQGDGHGRFVLSAPALDQFIPLSQIYTDVATLFNFWSH
jgi:hypothetical protein